METIQELAAFCGKRNIHLISNEVYANSVWRSDEAAGRFVPFTSILSLDLDQHIDPNMVHLVYGASKDFSANGLRVGVFHSRNEGLLKAVGSLRCVSLPTSTWASLPQGIKPSAYTDLLRQSFLLDAVRYPRYLGPYARRQGVYCSVHS